MYVITIMGVQSEALFQKKKKAAIDSIWRESLSERLTWWYKIWTLFKLSVQPAAINGICSRDSINRHDGWHVEKLVSYVSERRMGRAKRTLGNHFWNEVIIVRSRLNSFWSICTPGYWLFANTRMSQGGIISSLPHVLHLFLCHRG